MKKFALVFLLLVSVIFISSQPAMSSTVLPTPSKVLDEDYMIVSGYVVALGYNSEQAKREAELEMWMLIADVQIMTGWQFFHLEILDEGYLSRTLYFIEFDAYFYPPEH